jgi:membrane protein YdbS with pleckstrin-like domain
MDDNKKHSLGRRAFFLFLSGRIKWVIIWYLVVAALWYTERWLTTQWIIWWNYGLEILALVVTVYFILLILRVYMEYRYYTYMFTEEAFIMTYGVVMRSEVAALYHQIQNVNIERGVLDRMAGVSRIVIFMTGAERDAAHSKIVLPAVGRKKAKLVQKELLVRARRHAGV